MQFAAGPTTVHYVAHGSGRPVLVLHGAGVDRHEAEACFEPALRDVPGLRRIYPDLPGMGRTPATSLDSADDVVDVLLAFAEGLCGDRPYLVAGHSAGAHFALGLADRAPGRVAGLALVCPLLPGGHDVPGHRVAVGDEAFRDYFVVQTPAMLERYLRYVAPAAELVDEAALGRIGERWQLTRSAGPAFAGPALVVAGRLDSTVGHEGASELAAGLPHATLAVLDEAGRALPHEQPDLMRAHLLEWLRRVERRAGRIGEE